MASMSRDEIVGYTKKQKTEASKRGHKTMRELGIGFNNPEQQAEFGRRSAAVGKTPNRVQGYVSQSRTRNSVYPSLFEKPIIFSFTDAENQLEILVAASTFQRTGDIRDFLLKNTPETSRFFEKIQNDKSFPSNFNKVLRNLLPVEQQFETRPQYQGWKVKFGNDQTN